VLCGILFEQRAVARETEAEPDRSEVLALRTLVLHRIVGSLRGALRSVLFGKKLVA